MIITVAKSVLTKFFWWIIILQKRRLLLDTFYDFKWFRAKPLLDDNYVSTLLAEDRSIEMGWTPNQAKKILSIYEIASSKKSKWSH